MKKTFDSHVFYDKEQHSKKHIPSISYMIGYLVLGFGLGYFTFYLPSTFGLYLFIIDTGLQLTNGFNVELYYITLFIFTVLFSVSFHMLIRKWVDDKYLLLVFRITFVLTYLVFFIMRTIDFNAL